MASQPELIGDYKVLRELGRGAMGVVYLAVHPSLGRQMALKVMARDLAGDPEFLERFRREGEAAAKLRHPNIVQVFDFAHRDGLYFIAMEYLGARTLKDLLEESGQQPVGQACAMMDELLSALALAHSKGIVHRDIKPANVMLTDDGPVALTDFSIAHMKESSKLTQTGAIVGTPEYMAPEQFDGTWDARSDLYAVGIVLYELLTGFSPFRSATMTEVMRKQLLTVPDPPSVVDFTVPEAVSRVVSRALEKNPEARYQSAQEMRSALKQALAAASAQAEPARSEGEATHVSLPASVVPTTASADGGAVSPSTTLLPLRGESPPAPDVAPPLPVSAEAAETSSPLDAGAAEQAQQPRLATSAAPPAKSASRRKALAGVSFALAGALFVWGLQENSKGGAGAATPAPAASSSPRATPTPTAAQPQPVKIPPASVAPPPPQRITSEPPRPPAKKLFPSKAYIAPGLGVGDVGLGVGKAKVRKLWGEPSDGVSKDGMSQWLYGGTGTNAKCIVFFNKKNVVEAIGVLTPDFVIAGDPYSKVGSSYDAILDAYPNPDYSTDISLDYADQGLFYIFRNDKCFILIVYARGRNFAKLQILK
jgi:serine/threonine protein kinase